MTGKAHRIEGRYSQAADIKTATQVREQFGRADEL